MSFDVETGGDAIELLLLLTTATATKNSPSSSSAWDDESVDNDGGVYDSWGGGGDDDDDAKETAVDNDSYFASIKKGLLNSMQSSACRAATLNYTGFKSPLLFNCTMQQTTQLPNIQQTNYPTYNKQYSNFESTANRLH